MRSPKFLIAMLVVSVTAAAIAHDLFPHRMRARRRCALPGYDYRSRSRRSRSIDKTTTAQEIDNPAISAAGGVPGSENSTKIATQTVTKTVGDTVTKTVTKTIAKTVTKTIAKPRRKIRVFQQGSSALTDDHCEISKLTVILEETGRWVVSFDAEQNAQLVTPATDRPAFERFQRNSFYVELRGLGLSLDSTNPLEKVLASPQFFQIKLPVVRVEKGQTRSLRFQSRIQKPNANVKRYFSQIDRVEIHFRYE